MKALVLNGHPRSGSLCDAVAQTYTDELTALGAEVRLVNIRDLKFDALRDPTLREPDEEDVLAIRKSIEWCNHLVIVFPTWWTSVPAQTKGFLDRVLTSGWAFSYKGNLPVGLLKGRSGRIICTMGAPVFYNRFFQGQPQTRMMRDGVLGFCGIKPVRVTALGGVSHKMKDAGKLLAKVRQAARKDF